MKEHGGTNKQETDDLESRIQCSLDNSLELFKHCPTQHYLLEDYERYVFLILNNIENVINHV